MSEDSLFSGEGSKPVISVVLPSYNDKQIILPYYNAITGFLNAQEKYDYELIYVDDGSTDNSQHELRKLAEKDHRVIYIELFRNYGQQRALFAGLSESRGDYVITLDGDYQYEPDVIMQLVEAVNGDFDIASGIRHKRYDNPLSRLLSKLGNIIIRCLLKIPVKDFGSVKVFSRNLVQRILEQEHYFSDVYPTAFSLKPSLVEVDVIHRDRLSGKSHWNFWMRLRLYVDIYISHKDEQFQLPFRLGVYAATSGAAGGSLLLAYKFLFAHQMSYVQILFATFITIIVGFAVSAWSLTMSLLVKIYKQNVYSRPFSINRIYRNGKQDRVSR